MEAIQNVATVDKFGAGATIVTGELTRFMGIPIIPSAFMREDLNASAVYDGSTTSKGSMLLLNKRGFLTGSRRQLTVETDRNIQTQTFMIVASFRKAFVPLETLSATITPVSLGYNWDA